MDSQRRRYLVKVGERGKENLNFREKGQAWQAWEKRQLILDASARKLAREGIPPAEGDATSISDIEITNKDLLEKLKDINRLNAVIGGEDEEDIETLKEGYEKISNTKVTTEEEEGQKDRILRRIADLIRQQREREEERRQRQEEEARRRAEMRERRGLQLERRLTDKEKATIVLEDETKIEPYFNRMFTSADSRAKESFRDAFGTKGELEFGEFIGTLTEALGCKPR
jgi:hypothetical protein